MQHDICHLTKTSFITLDNYVNGWSVNLYENDDHVKVDCSSEHSASELFEAIKKITG